MGRRQTQQLLPQRAMTRSRPATSNQCRVRAWTMFHPAVKYCMANAMTAL